MKDTNTLVNELEIAKERNKVLNDLLEFKFRDVLEGMVEYMIRTENEEVTSEKELEDVAYKYAIAIEALITIVDSEEDSKRIAQETLEALAAKEACTRRCHLCDTPTIDKWCANESCAEYVKEEGGVCHG